MQEAAEVSRLNAEAKQSYANQDPATGNALRRQATEIEALWPRQYPQWWADRGVLADSDQPGDAIKLLDAFKEASKPAPAQVTDPVKEQKQKRLATVVAPKQASSGGPSVLPDSAGLAIGYNRVRRA